MGIVVNKSFSQVRKDIAKKSDKLLNFLVDNNGILYGEWTRKQNKIYEQLNNYCLSLAEELDNLEEIEVPDFEKVRK